MVIATVNIIIRFVVPPYNSMSTHLVDLVKFTSLELKYWPRKARKLLVNGNNG
jgi:hypothetical protein